ncbi:integrase [Bordetella bronchialis]|uniref:Integrase n=1 Tax=Bordetella bronchialis TaxID=463025 RepID=A0A193FVY6_9BORD|nr:integrase [Bordetella bronchialis]
MRTRTKDRHLPPCVYRKHGALWLVKKGKWQRLGSESDLHGALQEYARLVAAPTDGMVALIDKALPAVTEGRAPATVKQYQYCAQLLKEVFADFRPEQVRHGDIVQMMDGFKDRQAIANRMLTVLRLVFRWALDRELVQADPTVSVQRFKQTARERLISDREFAAIYQHAAPWLQCVMDLCYLTGQRIGDVLKIERGHLQEEGVFIEQQKTGKKLIVGWTPELREAVERAKKTVGQVQAMTYILAGRRGRLRAHTNVWRAFKLAAERAGVENVTLHDLRAMAGTEAERQGIDPTALLGHTDRRTTRIYLRDRSAKVVASPRKKAG